MARWAEEQSPGRNLYPQVGGLYRGGGGGVLIQMSYFNKKAMSHVFVT